jgi:DNA-directed RNA polymerase subunit beta'
MINEQNYNELNFESIKIGLASPETIRNWSYGEVTKPETINYRTLKPEPGGLFCERIFGPTKDWECHCGKYKRIRYKGKVCEKCGVKITKAKVRRERMGHIELACPVSHIWYFKGIPSRIGLMLDISPKELENVLYFIKYIVTDVDPDSGVELEKGQVISDREYDDNIEMYGPSAFKAKMGAAAVKKLLSEIDVNALDAEIREELDGEKPASGQKRQKLLKRLECVDAFKESGNRPEWMILDCIPVIPPDLRPMVQLDGGRFATSDLNDLYRRVINRNNRLAKLLEVGAPDIVKKNEMRMLQEAVDALIDNGRRGRPVTGASNRPLKSLSDLLKGKQGRFRQNLLGKRVDYSGRSVIVVGPELKMYQCGVPKEMALELFKPFVMKRLVELEKAKNIKAARKMVDKAAAKEVWDALDEAIKDHPVMLNRAPTLHRLSIQAFEPVLVEGRALKLHPLACTAFNADFDGDQMAIHVPLSSEAQAEARFLMLASNNLLKPADGKPVTVPTQDMVLGSYYLTLHKPGAKGEGKAFSSVEEAIMAKDAGDLDIHAMIKVRVKKQIKGVMKSQIIETTLGRIIFNDPIPQDLGYVDRSVPGNEFKLEVDFLVGKKQLGQIIGRAIKVEGVHKSSVMLDKIKAQGYKYSTLSGITFSVFDAKIPHNKNKYIEEAQEKVDRVNEMYRRGLASNEDRSKYTIRAWTECKDKVDSELTSDFTYDNPIFMIADSGARGSTAQLGQIIGMRGLIASTSGKTIEVPIKSNYRQGLNVLEYFIASRGARKGLTDTALRTADSGYLTRRLVDVSQDLIIREYDCGSKKGLKVSAISDGNRIIETLEERLTGRFLLDPFTDPETGEVLVDNNHMMTEADAKKIVDTGAEEVTIRSLLTCRSIGGVCIKCYGKNLATSSPVQIGEAIGVIAAQSIGEPGTQLTMRNFHTGGVASEKSITQGLPRVEELFECRKPKVLAMISEIGGKVSLEETDKNGNKLTTVVVTNPEDSKRYVIPYDYSVSVKDGQDIQKGDPITEGSIYPKDLLEVLGVDALNDYLITQVQIPYRTQGVDINDKHIEVIVRQMLRKVTIEDSGDTNLLAGSTIEKDDFIAANEEIEIKNAEGARRDDGSELRPAAAKQVLLGITKASLATDSFLSAASFQETTRVLTDAAIKGKTDPLHGLKENAIIGKLLPCGTGMKAYRDVKIDVEPEDVTSGLTASDMF